jgi:DNA repair protein RadC
MLFLDNRNRLIADEGIAQEGARRVAQIMTRALALHATALIGVRVAGADADLSRGARAEAPFAISLAQAGATLSTTLHDMMLSAPGAWLSLRQQGMF